MSWDHYNILFRAIHESFQSGFDVLLRVFMYYDMSVLKGLLSADMMPLGIPLRLSQDYLPMIRRQSPKRLLNPGIDVVHHDLSVKIVRVSKSGRTGKTLETLTFDGRMCPSEKSQQPVCQIHGRTVRRRLARNLTIRTAMTLLNLRSNKPPRANITFPPAARE